MDKHPPLVAEPLEGRDLALFTGSPEGPAGVLTLELGSDVLVVFDAAEAASIVEIALRRPVSDSACTELGAIVGSKGATALRRGHLEQLVPVQDYRTTALARVALLDWVEQIWPVPSAECLWDLERIALCRRIGTPSMLARAEEAERSLRAHGPGHFAHLPEVVRLFEAGVTDADYELAVLAVRKELLARKPAPATSRSDAKASFPVAWDAVPRGAVDLSEDAIRVASDGTHVSMTAHQSTSRPLFVHLIGADESPDSFVPLVRRGNSYEAELPAPLGTSELEVTDDRSRPIRSAEDRQTAKGRRESFRALAAERRATSYASTDPGRAKRCWSIAVEHWTQVEAVVPPDQRARASARISELRRRAQSNRAVTPPVGRPEAFLGELATDPAVFDGLERTRP